MTETDTRTRILDVAQTLIQRLGANAMSYQQIADLVGIRKASIHHHFPTKEDLFHTLLERYRHFFLAQVDDILTGKGTPSEKLAAYVGLFDTTLREGKNEWACLCGMLGAELASLGSQSVAEVRRFYRENEERLEEMLEQGRQTGHFRFAGESCALAALIFALLEGGVLIARARGGRKHFKTMTDQLMRLVGM